MRSPVHLVFSDQFTFVMEAGGANSKNYCQCRTVNLSELFCIVIEQLRSCISVQILKTFQQVGAYVPLRSALTKKDKCSCFFKTLVYFAQKPEQEQMQFLCFLPSFVRTNATLVQARTPGHHLPGELRKLEKAGRTLARSQVWKVVKNCTQWHENALPNLSFVLVIHQGEKYEFNLENASMFHCSWLGGTLRCLMVTVTHKHDHWPRCYQRVLACCNITQPSLAHFSTWQL